MNFLYIGQYSPGTTSKMRADLLKKLLPESGFQVVDTHVPFFRTPTLFRSAGFRFKTGPLIAAVNRYIIDNTKQESYGCIWVDKAIFITPETTRFLRNKTKRLVHFSPDPAFTFHKSRHFRNSLPFYDLAVTTKSYELNHYINILGEHKTMLITQGFEPAVHKPCHTFEEKEFGITFLGHFEKERGDIVLLLAKAGFPVIVAGKYWKKFAERHRKNPFIQYKGQGIYGGKYAQTISKYQFSLGLLSKWIQEKHTTRTFEIPACGTALLTERNEETSRFFRDNEVIFYADTNDLVRKITYYKSHPGELQALTQKGYEKVTTGGFDYESILRSILDLIPL